MSPGCILSTPVAQARDGQQQGVATGRAAAHHPTPLSQAPLTPSPSQCIRCTGSAAQWFCGDTAQKVGCHSNRQYASLRDLLRLCAQGDIGWYTALQALHCRLRSLLCTAVYRMQCVLHVYCRVEASVMERLAEYPSLAQQQLQRTAVWLPRRLGVLLQVDPQQVSAAVAAFMTR